MIPLPLAALFFLVAVIFLLPDDIFSSGICHLFELVELNSLGL